MRRSAPLPDDICMCIPSLGRVCVWCERRAANPPETVEEPDAICAEQVRTVRSRSEHCPWNMDELPPHLQGLGYRGADQDGYDGEEWVSPVEHSAGNLIEAARELLDAREIT